MALPKEPRQKMINMMYLVLTALLALNVSAEILNAFKTVNRSIDNANGVLNSNNNNLYASLANKLSKPESRAKAEIWKPKADKVKELCAATYNKIEVLKNKVKEYGGFVAGKKDSLGYESNLDAATRLMDTEKEGPKLEAELKKLKEDLLNIDPEIKKEFAEAGLTNLHVQFMKVGKPPTNIGLGPSVAAGRARAEPTPAVGRRRLRRS